MDLLKEGKYMEAENIINNYWIGRAQQCYQPLGDIWIKFDHDGEATNCRRSLNLNVSN